MATAFGAGVDVAVPLGNIIAESGDISTVAASTSLAGIVVSNSPRTAGDELEEAVVDYEKKELGILIGLTTAEEIKIQIGSAMPLMTELSMEIKGRDLQTGYPRSAIVTSSQIEQAMANSIAEIIDVIKITLEKTPPELAADIVEKGVVLAGGGSLIKNLDKAISQRIEMPVYVADEPLDCVVKGTGKTLTDIEKLKNVLINSRKRK